ncbi:uncharacterized protein LOC111049206 isoform X3 [Nilaparvata lugens]|uniref:uncharacterized protein LOC111049206 isoform X3 n=2 Tax=Nilaparvata lugens TaxID=108931 RepID=UPI00193EB1CC|nr:uncharacterized protein LOC111049206 isoform X3 [Nilaparvata lugens]
MLVIMLFLCFFVRQIDEADSSNDKKSEKMLLKNHLDIIGRNEPIQRKARFWQSYVRALKGTDDMRAPEQTHYSRYPTRGVFRPLLSTDFPTWPSHKSIYDDPIHAGDRISVPGYRYLPISRDIYGISPRNIYPHHYSSTERYPPHGLLRRWLRPRPAPRSKSVDADEDLDQAKSKQPLKGVFDDFLFPDFEDLWLPRRRILFHEDPLKALRAEEAHDARLASIESLFPVQYRHPWMYKPRQPQPKTKITPPEYQPPRKSPSETVGQYFNYAGQPIYSRGGYTRRPLIQMLEPSPLMPKSMITRDPWWHEFPELRPFNPLTNWANAPFYLRDSFLSPVKRNYLWADHPVRPFAANPFWWLR